MESQTAPQGLQPLPHNPPVLPRAWIRVSREKELSHSSSLWGEAPEWRRVGSLQARPGPPGSAASEPWDQAKSRCQEPQRPHLKSGGNASTCLGHGKISRSHTGPGSCFCPGPATCWGLSPEGQRRPCQGRAGAGSRGHGPVRGTRNIAESWPLARRGPASTPKETRPAISRHTKAALWDLASMEAPEAVSGKCGRRTPPNLPGGQTLS